MMKGNHILLIFMCFYSALAVNSWGDEDKNDDNDSNEEKGFYMPGKGGTYNGYKEPYHSDNVKQYTGDSMDNINAEAQGHFAKLGNKILNSLITPEKRRMLKQTWKKLMKKNDRLNSRAEKLLKENMDTFKATLKSSQDILGPYSEVLANSIPEFEVDMNDMDEEYDDVEEVSWGEKNMQRMDQHMSKYISDYTVWTDRCKRFLLEFALYLKYASGKSIKPRKKNLLKDFARAATSFSPQDNEYIQKWVQKVAPSYGKWMVYLKSMCANGNANNAMDFGLEKVQGKIRSTEDLYAAMAYHQCWGYNN